MIQIEQIKNLSPVEELFKIACATILSEPKKTTLQQQIINRILCRSHPDHIKNPDKKVGYIERKKAVTQVRTAIICACFPILWIVSILYFCSAYYHLYKARNHYIHATTPKPPTESQSSANDSPQESLMTDCKNKNLPPHYGSKILLLHSRSDGTFA